MKTSPITNAPEMVLVEKSGHMFLRGDGNCCHEQHFGVNHIETQIAEEWVRHINTLAQLERKRHYEFCFLPAPDKQSVYWDLIASFADNRNIIKILEMLNPSLYLDPLSTLIELRKNGTNDPYPKVDTHWNTYAASRVLESILKKWNLSWSSQTIDSHLTRQEFHGDLGIKTIPKTMGVALNLDPKVWRKLLCYDNGVPDNGRIRVFSNPNSKIFGRLVVVGDSFSYRLIETAALVFSEVFQFHGSFIDRAFLRLAQPDYLIFEQTERFFIRGPRHSAESSFARLIEEKIESGIEIQSFIQQHRTLSKNPIKSLNQSLVIALAERQLYNLDLISHPHEVIGLPEALRTIRTHI